MNKWMKFLFNEMDKLKRWNWFLFLVESNCTIVWIRSNEFVVNGPDGRISVWKSQYEGNIEK